MFHRLKEFWSILIGKPLKILRNLNTYFPAAGQGKDEISIVSILPFVICKIEFSHILKSDCQPNMEYTKPLSEQYCSTVLRRGQSAQKPCGD